MKPELTQDRLKELLHYDPETGHFTWLVSRNGNLATAGSRAGTKDSKGYFMLTVDGSRYRSHRLAFLYMNGAFPTDEVDHINRDRSDNRWANLRPATSSENHANTKLQRNNTSGHRGVYWHARINKWQAQGKVGGKMVYLGVFEKLEDAVFAAGEWRAKTFGIYAA